MCLRNRFAPVVRKARSRAGEYVHAFQNRRYLSRLKAIRGRYAGERCVIMGNGPSLNKMDLELFRGESVWCTNRAYLLFDRISWRPKFYTGVDKRVIPDIASELNGLSSQLPDTQFFWPFEFCADGVLSDHPRAYWFNERAVDEAMYPELVFSAACHRYVVCPRTVTISAIQLASYLGFNPIYLIGCDTSYKIPSGTREENGDRRHLISTSDNDPNHFDPAYFGADSKWHAPHPERMIRHYEGVQRYCVDNGLTVINSTVGGMLEAFPREDYREVFGKSC